MIKNLLLFFVLCFSILKSQVEIHGIIKNSENEIVSYASIGIKDTNFGSLSDEKGNYKLLIPAEMKTKSVFFNAEGYTEKEVKVSDLEENGNIALAYKIIDIEKILMTSKKLKEKVIGEDKKPMLTFSKMVDKNKPTVEQGNIFQVYEKTILNSYSFHIIPSSKFEQITLKLNIYSVENGLPLTRCSLKILFIKRPLKVGKQLICQITNWYLKTGIK